MPLWQFSPSSEDLVRKCLSAAAPIDENNKWVQVFANTNDHIKDSEMKESMEYTCEEIFREENMNTESDDDFRNLIEAENFDVDFIEQCTNTNLITKLAQHLHTQDIERIFKLIFESKHLDLSCIQTFYKTFFQVFLKREFSRFSLDLLIQANNIHPEQFKAVINTLIKDLAIPNTVLSDFITSLNKKKQSNIFFTLTDIELSREEFVYHLMSIYTAYKDSEKTSKTQNYIFNNMKNYCDICKNEKVFGRLLLAFLQAEKQRGSFEYLNMLERIVDSHCSPFKRSCFNILNHLKDMHT